MNGRILELIEQAYVEVPHERDWDATSKVFDKEKFAKLHAEYLIKYLETKAAELSDPDDEGFAEGFTAGIFYASNLVHYAHNSEHIEG